MKPISTSFLIAFLFLLISNLAFSQQAQLQPLWKDGIPNNPVNYSQELVRTADVNESSPSQMNRVFSQVSEPEYIIYKAVESRNQHVGIVICPGGGFRDVWFDREGVDFALWLADKGITSLVLKYRTFNKDADGFKLERDKFNPEVYADAKQAIYILKSKADELGIDTNKIGIGGFSAGGALSLMATLEIFQDRLPEYAEHTKNTTPDFACLIYPGIADPFYKAVGKKRPVPPVFMVNGAEDVKTPALRCLKLYETLLENDVKAELHIYGKGGHGFDSGIGRGYAVETWQNGFIAWLKDMGFLT